MKKSKKSIEEFKNLHLSKKVLVQLKGGQDDSIITEDVIDV